MNIDQLVLTISNLIIPVLPYLIKGIKISGKKAAEKLGELSASHSIEIAQKIWGIISPKKIKSRKLTIALEELSKHPRDKDWTKLFQEELRDLLRKDKALFTEIIELLSSETPEQIVIIKKNTKIKIEQSSLGRGKQKVEAEDNKNITISQTIKK